MAIAEFDPRHRALLARLAESCAQADRGEGYTEEELRVRMAERRANQPLAPPPHPPFSAVIPIEPSAGFSPGSSRL
jgi:hypothetical protein